MRSEVDILLSTYNGEKYLDELFESIIKQTYKYWNLIIRDDGSSDSTLEILKKYENKYPDRIRIIEDNKGNLGSSKSFLELIRYSHSKYIMFCDQDDIWSNKKIEVSINEIKRLEDIHNTKIPLLIATDLQIVDEDGYKVLEESFWESRKDGEIVFTDYHYFIAQSVLTGCTMMMNKASVNLILSVNSYIDYFQHDQWISIFISYYGEVSFINKQLVNYRQHRNNVIGSYRFNKSYLFRRVKHISNLFSALIKFKKRDLIEFSILKVLFYKFSYNMKKLIK